MQKLWSAVAPFLPGLISGAKENERLKSPGKAPAEARSRRNMLVHKRARSLADSPELEIRIFRELQGKCAMHEKKYVSKNQSFGFYCHRAATRRETQGDEVEMTLFGFLFSNNKSNMCLLHKI